MIWCIYLVFWSPKSTWSPSSKDMNITKFRKQEFFQWVLRPAYSVIFSHWPCGVDVEKRLQVVEDWPNQANKISSFHPQELRKINLALVMVMNQLLHRTSFHELESLRYKFHGIQAGGLLAPKMAGILNMHCFFLEILPFLSSSYGKSPNIFAFWIQRILDLPPHPGWQSPPGWHETCLGDRESRALNLWICHCYYWVGGNDPIYIMYILPSLKLT